MLLHHSINLNLSIGSLSFLEGLQFSHEKKEKKIEDYFFRLKQMEAELKQQETIDLEGFLTLQRNVVAAKSTVDTLSWIPLHLEKAVAESHVFFDRLQTDIYRKFIPCVEDVEKILPQEIEKKMEELVHSIDLRKCEPEEEWPEWEEAPSLWRQYQHILIEMVRLSEIDKEVYEEKYASLRYQAIHLCILLERFRLFFGDWSIRYLLNGFAGNRTGDFVLIEKFSDPRFFPIFKVAVALLESRSNNHILEQGIGILRPVLRYLSPQEPSTISFLRFFFDRISATKFQNKPHKRKRCLEKLMAMVIPDPSLTLIHPSQIVSKKLRVHSKIENNQRIRRFCSIQHYQNILDTTWLWKLDAILADFRKEIFLLAVKQQIERKRQEESEKISSYMIHLLQLYHKRYCILIHTPEEKKKLPFFYLEKIQPHFFSFSPSSLKEKMIDYVMRCFQPSWISSLENHRLYIKKGKITYRGASALLFQAGYLVE